MIDNNFKISTCSVEDITISYTWSSNFISKIGSDSMGERLEIEFLDKNGWVQK